MTAYLRWMLRQLYLIFFWPSLFEREIDTKRERTLSALERLRHCFGHLMALMPAVVMLILLIVGFTGVLVSLDILESRRSELGERARSIKMTPNWHGSSARISAISGSIASW